MVAGELPACVRSGGRDSPTPRAPTTGRDPPSLSDFARRRSRIAGQSAVTRTTRRRPCRRQARDWRVHCKYDISQLLLCSTTTTSIVQSCVDSKTPVLKASAAISLRECHTDHASGDTFELVPNSQRNGSSQNTGTARSNQHAPVILENRLNTLRDRQSVCG